MILKPTQMITPGYRVNAHHTFIFKTDYIDNVYKQYHNFFESKEHFTYLLDKYNCLVIDTYKECIFYYNTMEIIQQE